MTTPRTVTRWRLGAALAVVVAGVGCGTRLPDSAFGAHPATSPSASASSQPNDGATAPGVTSDTITIGTIASLTNPFDANAFTGPLYGLRAFVDDINRRGGINGRELVLKTCDDGGSGNQNVVCVRRLIEQDHVFALVSAAIFNYDGAEIVNSKGVPDVGSQPIDVAYTRYAHLWDIGGESYPRDGTVGWNGWLHGGTEVYRYFKVRFPNVPERAGVVYYNEASSQRYGEAIVRGLRREGYDVVTAQVNFALPDYDSVAVKFRNAGVSYVYDAIDRFGNQRLCRALDENNAVPVAKITTTQSWVASIRTEYAKSPRCRNVIYATGNSRNYDDVSFAPVAQFRTAMARLGLDKTSSLSEWALEGWAGAQWFADAAASCGAALTRGCLENYLRRPVPYDGHGLLLPRTFTVGTNDLAPHRSCINVVRWQDAANDGAGGWVDAVSDMNDNCFVVPSIAYRP